VVSPCKLHRQLRLARTYRPIYEILSEPAHRGRVEEGGGCGRGSARLPYGHAVEEVAVAAHGAVAREADGLARLFAYRAYEAAAVSRLAIVEC
jgi:hypothetical protein